VAARSVEPPEVLHLRAGGASSTVSCRLTVLADGFREFLADQAILRHQPEQRHCQRVWRAHLLVDNFPVNETPHFLGMRDLSDACLGACAAARQAAGTSREANSTQRQRRSAAGK
jgi:flavin-dependent dehydrogenase